VIVGGGLAGLSAGCELATRGAKVTIVERNQHLGGKMNVLSERGFTFDMGPTILTMPDVLRGIITRSGRRVADYIDLVRLDPQWRCFYDDGTRIDLREDVSSMSASLDAQFPGKRLGEGWRAFVAYSRRMYSLSERVFFYKDLGGIGDLMRKPPAADPGLLKEVAAMRLHSTVGATARKHLGESHILQLAEHFLQYVGSSPFLAPAILTLIASAQVDHGCWYAMGGTRTVAQSLERILREEGATILTGSGVRRIVQNGSRATGVELDDGRVINSDAVLSNCDVQRTNRDLLGTSAALSEQRKIARRYTPACSGVVLYLGLDRRYEHLLHHDFIFSKNSHEEFDDIYTKGIPARDPTIYLCAPSRTDPTQAPPGCESLYALIHTPYLRPGHDWDSTAGPNGPGMFASYRSVIINKLKRCGMEDIERHIVVERRLTPNDIERMYNAEGGAIYGLASHGRLKGGFKPRNTSPILKNLYLAGGSTNPGPGVPMVLMSGVTAATSLADDFGLPGRDGTRATHEHNRPNGTGAWREPVLSER